MTRQTAYAFTDITARQASPQRLGQLARSQWVVENRLSFVRDATFTEYTSKIRTGDGPRQHGHPPQLRDQPATSGRSPKIAAGLREMPEVHSPPVGPPRPA
ncbi:hypothetical protein [Streptomyces sp. NPDC054834]